MAGSGWDSASRGRGASIEWLDLGVATLLLVAPPPPCLLTLLSVWTKGREKIAVARDKGMEQPPKRVSGVSNPT